jgi:3-deoxy-D-manno-octulosonic-acid transferase
MIEALARLGLRGHRKTNLPSGPLGSDDVVVVDTFGELNRLYAIASVAFLGGTTYVRNELGLGQNPIEPLIQGCRLFFGPVMGLWGEITAPLKEMWGGVEVSTPKELAAGTVAMLEDAALARRFEQTVAAVLAPHRGDVERNVALVRRVVEGAR